MKIKNTGKYYYRSLFPTTEFEVGSLFLEKGYFTEELLSKYNLSYDEGAFRSRCGVIFKGKGLEITFLPYYDPYQLEGYMEGTLSPDNVILMEAQVSLGIYLESDKVYNRGGEAYTTLNLCLPVFASTSPTKILDDVLAQLKLFKETAKLSYSF